MGKYYYDAFISYRHKKQDSFAAEKIHKMLEQYHVPKRIQKVSGKKKIERVFRDRDELPTSSNLGDNIRDALKNAEYLIVVCSPDVIESQWVQQEIELFLETHSRDKILAVLISGEPLQAFPRQLRIAEEEVTGQDGRKTVIEKKVEPLAADIRAKSQREMEKKLKKEILRLLAPLLSCSYDDLRQRHREYAMKKAAAAVAIVCCLTLSFTVYALHQAARIQKQYQRALEEESRYLAEISGELLKDGDRIGALRNAVEALPKEEDDRPLRQEAVFALNNALYSYCRDEKIYFRPDTMTEPDSRIEYRAGFSTDDSYYMEIDKTGCAYFYDCNDGALYWKVSPSELDGVNGNAFFEGEFYSDGKAVMLTENQVVFLDLAERKMIRGILFTQESGSFSSELMVHEKYAAIRLGYHQLMVFETSSGEMIYQKDFSEDEIILVSLKCFNEDGSVLAMETAGGSVISADVEKQLLLVTLKTGQEDCIQSQSDDICEALFLNKNQIAMLESKALEEYGDDRVSQVRVYDYGAGQELWTSEQYESHTSAFETGIFSERMKQNGAEKRVLGFYVNDMLVLAEEASGEIFVKQYFPDSIAGVSRYDEGRLLTGLRDGSIRLQTLDYNVTPVYAGNISSQISSFQYNEKYKRAIQGLRSGNASVLSKIFEDEGMKRIEVGGSADSIVHLPAFGEKCGAYRVIILEDRAAVFVQHVENTGGGTVLELDAGLIGEPEIYLYEKDKKLLLSYSGYVSDDSTGNRIVTIDVESREEIYREDLSDSRNITNGTILYSNQSDMAVSYSGSEFSIFQISDGKSLLSRENHLESEEEEAITGMWFSPDDRYLLVSVLNNNDAVKLKRWNIEQGKWEQDLPAEMNVSGDKLLEVQTGFEKNVMAVYADTTIWILDIESGKIWKKIPFYGETQCNFAFVDHDKYLLLYGDNQNLTLWNIEEEKAVMEQRQEFTFFSEFQIDPAAEYFAVKENAGYTETELFTGELHVFSLDTSKEEFYPYADISRGWISFEGNEAGCLGLEGGVYVSEIRPFETLRSQALEVLE